MTTAITKHEKAESAVEYIPFGAKDSIRLTTAMVSRFIAVPTRSGALPSERDCVKFVMLCKGKKANPFEGDCFLIGYDSQNGPSFSLVCGIDLFLKRAEASDDYDGKESGVIIKTADGIEERHGALVLDGETLVGGWCKVHRKGRSQPEYKSVLFKTYDTGKSRWQKDPGGMIVKVAESQALRAAYPTALGGLYTQEELQRVAENGESMITSAREPIEMPRVIEKPVETEKNKQEAPPAKDGEETLPGMDK